MPDITFTRTGPSIAANPGVLNVTGGEEVNFHTNERVYVTFDSKAWPFDEPFVTITVQPVTGAGPYTVRETTTVTRGGYTVSTQVQQSTPVGVMVSAEIDIEP